MRNRKFVNKSNIFELTNKIKSRAKQYSETANA